MSNVMSSSRIIDSFRFHDRGGTKDAGQRHRDGVGAVIATVVLQ